MAAKSKRTKKTVEMEDKQERKPGIDWGRILLLLVDIVSIILTLFDIRQNTGVIIRAPGFPEHLDFYLLFFSGSVAALLGGLLWNILNFINDKLPEGRKLMPRSPYVGGTSRTEPHERGVIIWTIATMLPLILILMVLNYLYHFIGLRTQTLLYIAFILGAGIGAKLFYDYPISGKVGIRAYFESKKYPYLRREFWCVVLWSFLISALGFLFMGITRWLVMPDLISFEAILIAFLRQVGWATGLTTLAVIFCVLIFPKEPRFDSARGIVAGSTFRLVLFFGLLIL